MRYGLDFTDHRRAIIGEGKHDQIFLAELCISAGLDGFCVDFAAGYDKFQAKLSTATNLTNFLDLIDLVVVCDSKDKPQETADATLKLIAATNGRDGYKFAAPKGANVANKIAWKSGKGRAFTSCCCHGWTGPVA